MLTIVILSCSTEKNTFVNRNFHNLNAHYNVYFNGKEAMKAGLEKIDTKVEEDFTKTLPIFKESLPGTESMVSSDMSTAVDKGLKLIKRHSITKPPEGNRKQKNPRKRKPVKPEYNKWVDDAYLMIGQAYLYQKDYIRAASTFTQVIRKYKDQPVKYNAYLWLMRTYTESERYTEARELMESLEGNDQFPDKLDGELAINAAELQLQQQHYDEAIQYLNIGIKQIKGNKRKVRYTFILAQLYQETGNKEKALETYHQVIRRRPDYKMLFNAQINMASVFSGDGNAAMLRKELNKMIKKKRNEPFLDQIYYALGNIGYNEGQIDDAIDLYKKSAAVSENNKHQRALSCLTLADIYFDRKKYIPAGMYYDSAMVEIDENYPNYKAIAEKHASLSRLVTNLLTVETQDSLQALAALSPEALNKKIDGWIKIEAERIKQDSINQMKAGDEYSMANGRSTSNRMRINRGSGGWYFYNPSTVSYGKKEFARLWGSRKNEDNWRRKDKSISMDGDLAEGEGNEVADSLAVEEVRIDDKTTREYYLQDIPNNDSLMAISNNEIMDALFNAGTIFKTEFNDYDRAIDCFNELNRRFPQNTNELPSYFYLWDLYNTVEKTDSATIFKNQILNNYPNSNYAKYLVNPNYFIEEEAKKDSLNNLYRLAYYAFKHNSFQQAERYVKMAKTMDPDTAMVPKLRFIEMVASSKGKDPKIFADSLSSYAATYPNSETGKLAQSIFELVKQDKLGDYEKLVNTGYINEVIKNMELLPENEQTNGEVVSQWNSEPDLLHYFIIAIPTDQEIDINRLKFDIANYNIDHYTKLDFDIESENLNNETELIIVRNFDNKETALIYFLSIIRKPEVFKTLAGIKFLNFIISNINYREMLSEHSYNEYLKFFVKNYSSFTSGKFDENELETPEELMARLKQEDQQLKEQGEYVVVKTDDGSYQAPEAKPQIFTPDYTVPHSFMLLIKEKRYRTGYLMRDLVRYNTAEFRSSRLRVIPNNLPDATMLVVSQFPDAYSANEYLKAVRKDEAVLSSLKDTEYEPYIISNQNLDKLRKTNNLDEWADFYKKNYIYRRPPAPASEQEAEPQQPNVNEPTKQNTHKVQPSEEIKADSAKTTMDVLPEENKAEADIVEKEAENETSKVDVSEKPDSATVEGATVVEDADTVRSMQEETSSYNGPFVYDSTTSYNIIYLLPSSGSNKTLLSTYVGRFNALKYRSFGLGVKTETFDEFRSIVVISGLADKEKALNYQQKVGTDARVTMSLRNVNYKSYLISNANLKLLKESKDINEYQRFYSTYFSK